LSRRQAIPSNWFQRDADPLPPLFPEPVDGDHYYNRTTGRLRVFIDGEWTDAAIDWQELDARYVTRAELTVSTAPPPANPSPVPPFGAVYIQY
jgi:hypothetical protein